MLTNHLSNGYNYIHVPFVVPVNTIENTAENHTYNYTGQNCADTNYQPVNIIRT